MPEQELPEEIRREVETSEEDIEARPRLATATFEWLRNPENRQELYQAVKKLVKKTVTERYEGLVFLDKSARPIAFLYQEIFKKFYRNRQDKPSINFLNIGRETTGDRDNVAYDYTKDYVNYADETDEFEVEDYGIDDSIAMQGGMGAARIRVPVSEIERIRGAYKHLAKLSPGSKVLVVNEVSNTDSSLDFATQILRESFPELYISDYALQRWISAKGFSQPRLFIHKGGTASAPWMDYNRNVNVPEELADEYNKFGITGVVDSNRLTSNSLYAQGEGLEPWREQARLLRQELSSLADEQYNKEKKKTEKIK